MGDIAEMMLDGTLCEGCGDFLGDADGFPRYCPSCDTSDPQINTPSKKKVNCDICGKRVKKAGLTDHKRAAHGEQP